MPVLVCDYTLICMFFFLKVYLAPLWKTHQGPGSEQFAWGKMLQKTRAEPLNEGNVLVCLRWVVMRVSRALSQNNAECFKCF